MKFQPLRQSQSNMFASWRRSDPTRLHHERSLPGEKCDQASCCVFRGSNTILPLILRVSWIESLAHPIPLCLSSYLCLDRSTLYSLKQPKGLSISSNASLPLGALSQPHVRPWHTATNTKFIAKIRIICQEQNHLPRPINRQDQIHCQDGAWQAVSGKEAYESLFGQETFLAHDGA